MNNTSENQYFLIIRKQKISFTAINSINEKILTKEIFIEDYSIDNVYHSIENFLYKNIFEFEKNLKNFINIVHIIFESDAFFVVGSSIKHNVKSSSSKYSQIDDTLIEIRNQFKKHSPNHEIIHMIINKYIIDGNNFDDLPEYTDFENLIIQVNFICINNKIIEDFKKIFSKYQISINKILSYEYIKELNYSNNKNIIKIANDNINGLNSSEVFIAKKVSKNQGFFEKFFNFFN